MMLQVVTLVVESLTAIAVVAIGWWVSRHLKRLEQLQWASQKVVEKRLEVYSSLAPVLNDLYCCFDFIGDWKMADPISVLGLKRTADRLFYVNAALFSRRFRQAYERFLDLCFVPGPLDEFDATAKLRTSVQIRKDMFAKRNVPWKPEWDDYFAPAERLTPRAQIVEGYRQTMDTFVQELGVGLPDHDTSHSGSA